MVHKRKKDYLEKGISPQARFVLGLSFLPFFWLESQLLWVFLQTLVFAFLARLSGKRLQWMYFIGFTMSIVFFSLLSPAGKKIAQIAFLPITQDALTLGLLRSFHLIGSIFISLFSVHKNLQLPFQLGKDLGASLSFFNLLMEHRWRIRHLKGLIPILDQVLLEAEERFIEDQKNIDKAHLPFFISRRFFVIYLMMVALQASLSFWT